MIDIDKRFRGAGATGCAAIAFAGLLLAFAGALHADSPPVLTDVHGVALGGFDAVSYFSDGGPVMGSADFETTWSGAKWRFANAADRDAFVAAPEKYAPQYGGYCAYAVAKGGTAPADPTAWKVVDGKLYLNYSQSIRERWLKDVPGYIAKADQNWPGVLKK